MVSKKKLTAGIALVATAAFVVSKWKGSAEPVVEEEDLAEAN
jgi:hypothetical protein